MEYPIFEVSQINTYIKEKFDSDPFLGEICIRGELSNYKVYPSGHHYFTLKDTNGALRCVMFRSSASRLRFHPENGMKVITVGRITVFLRDGTYQLYCANMTPDGVGDLHVAYEQLKAKLLEEGLFAQAHKKPLPEFPHRIAVITSSAGAAVHDILRILRQRYPLSRVFLLPVRVQGDEAPLEIASAIQYANLYRIADVILTGRGGGSIEDLWAFNDERVARAIYNSEIPVVSAVGHEPDVTIADFVADMRAATPSNGAELITPDCADLRQRLKNCENRILKSMEKQLKLSRQHWENLAGRRVLQSPTYYIEDRRMMIDHIHNRLGSAAMLLLERNKHKFGQLAIALDAMSPLKVLGRGYAVAQKNTAVIHSVLDAAVGDQVDIRLADGTVHTMVTAIQEET